MGEEPGGVYIEVLKDYDTPVESEETVEPEEPTQLPAHGDEYVDVELPLPVGEES